MVENSIISIEGQKYIHKVDELLELDMDLDDLSIRLDNLKIEVAQKLNENDCEQIHMYVDTVRASMYYWIAHFNGQVERSIWSKVKKNIKKISISAGLGALVGFAGGFIVTENPIAAGVVALASAGVSAYESYNTGDICILVKPVEV